MTGRFAGKVAVVAGCARPPGMGHATALRLARAGASVVCADAVGDPTGGIEGSYDTGIVAAEVLDSVTAEVAGAGDGSAVSYRAEPFDQSSWEGAAALAVATFGRVDICCSLMGSTGPNAGDGPLLDVALSSWQRCFDINVVAPLLLSRACAAHMIDQGDGGVIVILSSYSAVRPPPGNAAIAAARSAVNRMTEVFALELAEHGIRVNAVQPLGVQSNDPRFPNPGTRPSGPGGSRIDVVVGSQPGSPRPGSDAGRDRRRHRVPLLGRCVVHQRRLTAGRRWFPQSLLAPHRSDRDATNGRCPQVRPCAPCRRRSPAGVRRTKPGGAP